MPVSVCEWRVRIGRFIQRKDDVVLEQIVKYYLTRIRLRLKLQKKSQDDNSDDDPSEKSDEKCQPSDVKENVGSTSQTPNQDHIPDQVPAQISHDPPSPQTDPQLPSGSSDSAPPEINQVPLEDEGTPNDMHQDESHGLLLETTPTLTTKSDSLHSSVDVQTTQSLGSEVPCEEFSKPSLCQAVISFLKRGLHRLYFAGIRLLRAGDVESNPGPNPPNDVEDIEFLALRKEIPVSEYYDLGIGLGFQYNELKQILTSHQLDVQSALLDILQRWKVKGHVNMRAELAEMLRDVELNAIAEKLIIGSYQSKERPSTSAGGSRGTGKSSKALSPEQVAECRKDLEHLYRSHHCRLKEDHTDFMTLTDFNDIYTNLTLLDKNGKRTKPLEYSDFLKIEINGVPLKRLLVEGEAGAGKTTLCAKIAWDWLTGSSFQEFELVLIVPLREVKSNKTFGDIVKTYLLDASTAQPAQIDEFIRVNPDKVLIVLDGLDEYDGDLSNLESTNPLVQILQSRQFKSCLVLVTTRPWKADEIRCDNHLKKVYDFIKVEGFNKENLSSYISKFFSPDQSKADDLIQFLVGNDVISENMAPYPLYAAMLCIMWKDITEERRKIVLKLKTFSQLFSEMIFFLKKHYLLKPHTNLRDQKLAVHRQKVEEHMMKISEIAFKGLLDNCLVFSEDQFDSCHDVVQVGCKLGILSQETKPLSRKERSSTGPWHRSTVFFPHKLFQEYMASLYLGSLYYSDRRKYKKLIKKKILQRYQEFRYLLYFTVSHRKEVGHDIMTRITDRKHDMFIGKDFIIDVAFECHERDVAKVVETNLALSNKSLEVSGGQSAHTVSGYLFVMETPGELHISNRACGITLSRDLAEAVCELTSLRKVVLQEASFHDDFYSILACKAASSRIETLELACRENSQESASASRDFTEAICAMPLLTSLVISCCICYDDFFATLSSHESTSKIQTLELKRVYWQGSASESRDVAKAICVMPRLTSLDIECCIFHDEFYATLSSHASKSKIQTLKLTEVKLQESASASRDFAKAICAMRFLISLSFSFCSFHDDFYALLSSHASTLKLELLTFEMVPLRNNARSILNSLRNSQCLKCITMSMCDTDHSLDGLIKEINKEGRMRVNITHILPYLGGATVLNFL